MEQIRRLITAVVLVLVMPLSLWASDKPSTQRPNSNQEKLQKLLQSRALEKKFLKGAARYQIGGNSGGGGGDEIGLDFQRTALQAVSGLRSKLPELYATVKDLDLEAVISSMDVVVVNEDIDVEAAAFIQNSVAVNFPDSLMIVLNRGRWLSVRDQGLREGIALHEVLSLAKVESTANYPVSAKYATTVGSSAENLTNSLRVDRAKQLQALSPQASLLEVLQQNYEESAEPLSLATLKEFANYRKYSCMWVSKNLNDGSIEAAQSGSMRGYLAPQEVFFVNRRNRSIDHISGEMMKAPNEQFVIITNETSVMELGRRTMNVRKNKGQLTFNWIEKKTSPGQGSTEKSVYGYCYTQF